MFFEGATTKKGPLAAKLLLSFFVFTVLIFLGIRNAAADTLAVVSGETADAYTSPSFDSMIAASLEEGEILDVISASDDWLEISFDSETLYIPMVSATVLQADGLVAENGVCLKRSPSYSADTVMNVQMGAVLTVTSVCGDFYAVDYAGISAYVYKDFVLGDSLKYVEELTFENYISNFIGGTSVNNTSYLTVTAQSGLNFRSFPSMDAPIITKIPFNTVLDAVEIDSEWHKAVYNGVEGYVSAEYTVVSTGQKLGANGMREQIVNYAMQFLGTRYVWGGTNLSKGVDCSGFVYSVYKNAGITLNRSSRDQIKNGTKISKNELQPGDLVFFNTTGSKSGTISHVGMYIGNGNFIHSSSAKKAKGVVISSLNDDYYARTYVGACKIIN